jgi:hypothetical protein
MNGMPGGVGVIGPGAKAAEKKVARLSVPPNATLDQLADTAISAVHTVAAANNVAVSVPPRSSQTRDRLIIGAGLLALVLAAFAARVLIRRNRG